MRITSDWLTIRPESPGRDPALPCIVQSTGCLAYVGHRAWIFLFGEVYSSMIPRVSPIVTAWVRCLLPSLDRMCPTWFLTVSSVIDN
jgi:hypothetical protein